MASYVSRRRRWYRSLTTLDKTFRIPEHFQLEMKMDCADITDHMQQLARLAARNPLSLETLGLALVQEYPLIHASELSRSRSRTMTTTASVLWPLPVGTPPSVTSLLVARWR